MPLRTYQSDKAEAKAAKGGSTNPLFYLGMLAGVGGALWTLAKARWALPLFLFAAVVMAVLGATGRLGFMTPLWDAIRDGWPV